MQRMRAIVNAIFVCAILVSGVLIGCSSPSATDTSSGRTDQSSSAPVGLNQEPTPSVTGGEPSEPEVATDIVHITRTGHKYHRGGCRYLSRSDIPVERSEAEARGLTPCSVCNP